MTSQRRHNVIAPSKNGKCLKHAPGAYLIFSIFPLGTLDFQGILTLLNKKENDNSQLHTKLGAYIPKISICLYSEIKNGGIVPTHSPLHV